MVVARAGLELANLLIQPAGLGLQEWTFLVRQGSSRDSVLPGRRSYPPASRPRPSTPGLLVGSEGHQVQVVHAVGDSLGAPGPCAGSTSRAVPLGSASVCGGQVCLSHKDEQPLCMWPSKPTSGATWARGQRTHGVQLRPRPGEPTWTSGAECADPILDMLGKVGIFLSVLSQQRTPGLHICRPLHYKVPKCHCSESCCCHHTAGEGTLQTGPGHAQEALVVPWTTAGSSCPACDTVHTEGHWEAAHTPGWVS